MNSERIVIVSGPRAGKSWLARELRKQGYPTLCADPRSMAKEPEAGVTYLAEGLAMENESTRYVVNEWFSRPGPWVCEGWLLARCLRKWLEMTSDGESANVFPCDKIIVLEQQRPELDLLAGQVRMHRGVMTVWNKIAPYFEGMVETRRWDDE